METYSLHGVLAYHGRDNLPWKFRILPGEETYIDLESIFTTFFTVHSGKAVRATLETNAFSLALDDKSEYILAEKPSGWWIDSTERFAFISISSYLDGIIQNINGRNAFLNVTPTSISIVDDIVQEDIVELTRPLDGTGNTIPIPNDMLVDVCRMGKGANTCAFLVSGRLGFECAKFDHSMGRTLLDRVYNKSMNAQRIGACRVKQMRSSKGETRG
jgi:hypothetical protein